LSSSIPDLHFDFNAINIYSLDFEIYANGGNMSHFILFVDISKQNISFSDSSVSDDDHLNQIVVLFLFSSFSHSVLPFCGAK
jgi:hypothetical protein